MFAYDKMDFLYVYSKPEEKTLWDTDTKKHYRDVTPSDFPTFTQKASRLWEVT